MKGTSKTRNVSGAVNRTLLNGMSQEVLWMGFPYVPSTAMIGLTPAKMTILALKTGLRILTSPLVSTAVQQRQSVSNLAR